LEIRKMTKGKETPRRSSVEGLAGPRHPALCAFAHIHGCAYALCRPELAWSPTMPEALDNYPGGSGRRSRRLRVSGSFGAAPYAFDTDGSGSFGA